MQLLLAIWERRPHNVSVLSSPQTAWIPIFLLLCFSGEHQHLIININNPSTTTTITDLTLWTTASFNFSWMFVSLVTFEGHHVSWEEKVIKKTSWATALIQNYLQKHRNNSRVWTQLCAPCIQQPAFNSLPSFSFQSGNGLHQEMVLK